MSKAMFKLAALAAAGVAGGVAVREYNTLARSHQAVLAAYADLDAQIERRHDTVRALIEELEGKTGFGKAALTKLADAEQTAAESVFSPKLADRARSEKALTKALRALFASFAGPTSPSENTLSLQEQLTTVENQIAFAATYHDSLIEEHNRLLVAFPTAIVARAAGMHRLPRWHSL